MLRFLALKRNDASLRQRILPALETQLHDLAVTCTNSTTTLLFSGQKDGKLRVDSLDVPVGASGRPSERGILLADLVRRKRG